MPRPYSVDLRERVLLACEGDEDNCTETARRFRIGVPTLHLWRKQARDGGCRVPRPMGRGPAPLGGSLEVLSALVAERNDATLAEYADVLAARTGERRSTPVICRALKRLGVGAQAETLRACEQDRADVAAARTAWRETAGIDPARLIFVDESGFDTRLIRTHARARHGQRAHGTTPGGHWHRLTLIGALGLDGIRAAMTVAAATSTAVFLAFVTQVLIPVLLRTRPDAVVVMDNLAAHKAAVMRKAFDLAGISHRYLPAYSPDMNPIEQAWSKLKAHLRRKAVRIRDALERAIPHALRTITPSDAYGWFHHAGYAPN